MGFENGPLLGFENGPLFRGKPRLTRTEGVEGAKRPE